MKLLVTGGCGFIGSNFINISIKKGIKIINIDKLTYASNIYKIKKNKKNYIFYKCDILNKKKLNQIFLKHNPDGVIHFAAESHVDRSIENPEIFFQSNTIGTVRLLEIVKEYLYKRKKKFKFVHVSTDEVYGSLNTIEKSFTEKNKFFPNSPYAASKAASDLIVRAYFKTFNLPVITTNCSNNYGKGQYFEKLIPLIISNALKGKKLPIYGNGLQIRDWLYVDDHCDAILKIFKKGIIGETYNIGGDNEIKNIYLVRKICRYLDDKFNRTKKNSFLNLIEFVKDRPGHDFRYSINSKKLKKELGWKPMNTFDKGIKLTIDWYLEQLKFKNYEKFKQ